MTNPGAFPSDWNTSPRKSEDSPSSLKYLNETAEAAVLGFASSAMASTTTAAQVNWKADPDGVGAATTDRWSLESLRSSTTPASLHASWNSSSNHHLNNAEIDPRSSSSNNSSGNIWGGDARNASFGSAALFAPADSNNNIALDPSSNHTDCSFSNSFSQLSVNVSQHSSSPEAVDPRVIGPATPVSSPMHPKAAVRNVSDSSSSYQIPSLTGSPNTNNNNAYALFGNTSNHTATTMQSTTSNASMSSVPGLLVANSGSVTTVHTTANTNNNAAPPGFDARGSVEPLPPVSSPGGLGSQSSLAALAMANHSPTSTANTHQQQQPADPSTPNSRRTRKQQQQQNHQSQQQQQQQPKRNRRRSGRGGGNSAKDKSPRENGGRSLPRAEAQAWVSSNSVTSSEAIRQLTVSSGSVNHGSAVGSILDLDQSFHSVSSRITHDSIGQPPVTPEKQHPILPIHTVVDDSFSFDDDTEYLETDEPWENKSTSGTATTAMTPPSKKKDWLSRMTRKLQETPVGELDPAVVPIAAVMNAWAKTKSAEGASMVETWLKRAQQEYNLGNRRVVPTTKMYTMAVDAWARSGEGGAAAQHAEALLQSMNQLYQSGGHESLRPTTGIFNAVINAWARSKEKVAPNRAEQILGWMQKLPNTDVRPDKYTFNTVIHAYAKAGGAEAAAKAQELLTRMHQLYQDGGNAQVKPDTITYNVVINCWAKSGGKGAAGEAEKLLDRMHRLHESGDPDVKPNVVTYGAVIDSFAKSGERGAAERADALLANMIQLHQSDPVTHADLLPNTYVFNTVINCWAKSKEHDAASKAEEMLLAMTHLNLPNLKPDAFTYTAVIDAWAKSGYRGAAARADQLLDKMEAKYLAGDMDLKPNTFTYNAVINALAKSGEAGAAARAERVLQNMVNRHRNNGGDDVKPTTINFNTVLDAWAKSGGGRPAAERAEEILEWMDRLHNQGNPDVKPDTITFNAVLDAWARSGDRVAPRRAEQILDHMDELFRSGNKGVKPDTYTYNTLINAWAKSGERGSAERAEHVLSVMQQRYIDGDKDFKPNTRTHTSVIDAWAKSGEKGAARRAEQILNGMISRYDESGDQDTRPNVHTANAVCNACAFSKHEQDRAEALQIAFRVFGWLSNHSDMKPDSYTYTILLSVCGNLLPRDDPATRFAHARAFFESCRDSGYVNDYVLRKLRQTVSEDEYLGLVDYRTDPSASGMPQAWTRNARINVNTRGRKGNWNNSHNNRRRGK